MKVADGTPVIIRQTKDGDLIALLPTIPVQGINSAIIAYSPNHGWFTSDTSIMNNTIAADKVNTWPILTKLIQEEAIYPLHVVKRITAAMDSARLCGDDSSAYNACRA